MKIAIYYSDAYAFLDEKIFLEGYARCSDYRKNKIDNCKILEDKARSLAAGLLLDYALTSFLAGGGNDCMPCYIPLEGMNASRTFECLDGEHGRPGLIEDFGISFSISHSEKYVMVAVSDVNVGADIQLIKTCKTDIAGRFFNRLEQDYLAACTSNYEENFFLTWAMKEAYIKLTGNGMSEGLDSFAILYKDGHDTNVIKMGLTPKKLWCQRGVIKDNYVYAVLCDEGET